MKSDTESMLTLCFRSSIHMYKDNFSCFFSYWDLLDFNQCYSKWYSISTLKLLLYVLTIVHSEYRKKYIILLPSY